MSTKEEREKSRNESIEVLRRILEPGSTVYCVLNHVARSGMQRRITFYALVIDPARRVYLNNRPDVHDSVVRPVAYPVYLNGHIEATTSYRRHQDGGLVVNGCGMDMGFAVVHDLARAIYGDGYALRHEWL